MGMWGWRATEKRVEVAREGRFPEAWEGMEVQEGLGWELTGLRKGGWVLGAGYRAPASAKIPVAKRRLSRKGVELPYPLTLGAMLS